MAGTSLRCSGCGSTAPPLREAPYPLRCPHAAEDHDIDHVLVRILDGRGLSFPQGGEPNPFARYRALFHAYHTAMAGGMTDAEVLALIARLDDAVAATWGHGFRVTPLFRSNTLSAALGFSSGGGVWVKDETGNVADSHKARHLMGLLIYFEVIDRLGLGPPRHQAPPLAIASCGNAALAAAVLARAAGRSLRVFVPPDADAEVQESLDRLGARRIICPREPGIPGDPCVRSFRAAAGEGALPFCCQGSEAGLTIDGGATLGAELAGAGVPFDRVFVQVGGGALASACMQGYADALALGRIASLPRFHAVQTRAVAPLKRACDRVAARIPRGADPAVIAEALQYAATHRSAFMWPWESEPRSLARAMIDDETYDWLAVVKGMLVSGGGPLTVGEGTLGRANALARDATGLPVGPSGSAGLAGLMQLLAEDPAIAKQRVAVIFSGVRG